MARVKFGELPDGSAIDEVSIGAGDLSARIVNFGAVIRDVRLAGIDHPLVLGLDSLDDYVNRSPHLGAVAGRYANRIAGGRLVVDGKVHQLTRNEDGMNTLHGGAIGFGHRPWRILDHDATSVTLAITSPNGEEGFPGRVEATICYSIVPPGILRMEASATTDATTVVNLAQHSYFNLDDSPDILDHEVQIFADGYTPANDAKIPTGEIRAVEGTVYDFRSPRPIRREAGGKRVVYDLNYVVALEKSASPRPHARLRSKRNGVTLDVRSTEPGVQFYDGCMMSVTAKGLGGRRYPVNGGCCFEPQFFPDSPNQPNFPSPFLRPGETYRQVTEFAFSRA